MGYEVLSQVTDIKKGPYGATEEQCLSLGGINKFTLKYSEKTEDITSAAKNGAVVGVYGYAAEAPCDMEGDQITLENLGIAMRGDVTGDSMLVTGNGGMLVPQTVYVYGLAADGQRKKMYIPAFVFAPDGNFAPERKQMTWQCKGRALRDDVLGGLYEFQPDPIVTTVPTLTASAPLVAGTLARAAAAALTFAVPLSADEVNGRNIFMIAEATNLLVAASVTQVGPVVSVRPAAQLGVAGAAYTLVVRPGLRSLSGVVNPLGYSIPFVTV